MAEDTVDTAIKNVGIAAKKCATKTFKIHGYRPNPDLNNHLYVYGSDMDQIIALPEYAEKLHPAHEYRAAEVVWAVRNEMARTVEDVLARRVRVLFLDAKLSIEMAPKVAQIMAKELGKDEQWQKQQVEAYTDLTKGFLI